MNAGTQGLLFSLGAMQVARKIDFKDPDVLNYVRIAYVTAQVIMLALYGYVSYTIRRKNDQTVLRYVEPTGTFSTGPGKLIDIPVRDYDLSEMGKLLRSVYMGIAMMGVMHLYFKFTQPLFVQTIMTLKALYEAKLIWIHVLGKPAEGDLKRPFQSPGMFGVSDGPQTDPASIAEAEKRAAKKDE